MRAHFILPSPALLKTKSLADSSPRPLLHRTCEQYRLVQQFGNAYMSDDNDLANASISLHFALQGTLAS